MLHVVLLQRAVLACLMLSPFLIRAAPIAGVELSCMANGNQPCNTKRSAEMQPTLLEAGLDATQFQKRTTTRSKYKIKPDQLEQKVESLKGLRNEFLIHDFDAIWGTTKHGKYSSEGLKQRADKNQKRIDAFKDPSPESSQEQAKEYREKAKTRMGEANRIRRVLDGDMKAKSRRSTKRARAWEELARSKETSSAIAPRVEVISEKEGETMNLQKRADYEIDPSKFERKRAGYTARLNTNASGQRLDALHAEHFHQKATKYAERIAAYNDPDPAPSRTQAIRYRRGEAHNSTIANRTPGALGRSFRAKAHSMSSKAQAWENLARSKEPEADSDPSIPPFEGDMAESSRRAAMARHRSRE